MRVPVRCGRRGELRVVAQERVEAGQDVQAGRDRREDDRPPRHRQLAAGRGDPDEQRVGPRAQRERLVERRDDRCRVPGQELVDVPSGLGRIQHGDDLVAPEADDPIGSLGVVVPEQALGQDDEAAGRGRSHPRESTDSRPSRCDAHLTAHG